MKARTFQTEMRIANSPAEVFPFFSDAGNLNRITPDWLHFKIETPMPVEMKEGTILHYRLRIRGISVNWITKIAKWEPPHRFVDVQLSGPYRLWVHHHEFEPVPQGTLMRDRVEYAVPGGILEPLIHRIFIYPDIQRIFQHRTHALRNAFDG